MKRWHLIYRLADRWRTKPIWPEGEPVGVFRVSVLGEEKTPRGKFVTVKYVTRDEAGFHADIATVRTANNAREIDATRLETQHQEVSE